jgi:hypothetical protein
VAVPGGDEVGDDAAGRAGDDVEQAGDGGDAAAHRLRQRKVVLEILGQHVVHRNLHAKRDGVDQGQDPGAVIEHRRAPRGPPDVPLDRPPVRNAHGLGAPVGHVLAEQHDGGAHEEVQGAGEVEREAPRLLGRVAVVFDEGVEKEGHGDVGQAAA